MITRQSIDPDKIVKSNEEIKDECNFYYDRIRFSHDRLEEIRQECKHEETFDGFW